jgi:hypothetical protein
MRRRIKRFVAQNVNHAFPMEQDRLDWNFTALTPKVSRFPGMSGGLDEYLGGWLPSEIGSITFSWKLLASNWAGLRSLKEAARAMAGAGTGRVLLIPEDQPDESRGLRWAEAQAINIAIPENAASGLRSQDATVTFQAVNPVWYGCEPTTSTSEPVYNRSGWWHLDDGITFDSGHVFGGPRVTQTGVNPDTQITCTNRGNHVTSPVLRFSVGTISGILGVRRLDPISLIAQDAFEWMDSMTAGQKLVIDCKNTSVVLETSVGDTDAYFNFFAVTGLGFIELAPGDNILEFYGDFSGLTVEIEYPDAWY